MTEANDFIDPYVTTDHAFGQTWLERLLDHTAIVPEISVASAHEFIKRHILDDAAALGMKNAHPHHVVGRGRYRLDLPHALAPVATVLLQNARPFLPEERWKLQTEFRRGPIKVYIAAPAEMLRPVQHLLDAHFKNDIGMGTDPRSMRGDFPQQWIERRPCLPLVDRIDPDENTPRLQELVATLIAERLIVDGRLGLNAGRRQFLEDAMKAVVLRRCVAPHLSIATPQHGDFAGGAAHSALPNASCRTTPASEQASNVCMMPILKRKIASAAASARAGADR